MWFYINYPDLEELFISRFFQHDIRCDSYHRRDFCLLFIVDIVVGYKLAYVSHLLSSTSSSIEPHSFDEEFAARFDNGWVHLGPLIVVCVPGHVKDSPLSNMLRTDT